MDIRKTKLRISKDYDWVESSISCNIENYHSLEFNLADGCLDYIEESVNELIEQGSRDDIEITLTVNLKLRKPSEASELSTVRNGNCGQFCDYYY